MAGWQGWIMYLLLALVVGALFVPQSVRQVIDHLFLAIGAPVLAARAALGNALRWLVAHIGVLVRDLCKPELVTGALLLLAAAGLVLPGALATIAAALFGAQGVDVPFLSGAVLSALQSLSLFASLALFASLVLELSGVPHWGLASKLSPAARWLLGIFAFGCFVVGLYTLFQMGGMRTELLSDVPASAMRSTFWVQTLVPLVIEAGAVVAVLGASHSFPLILAFGLSLAWCLVRLADLVLEIPERVLGSLRQLLLALLDIPIQFGERMRALWREIQSQGADSAPPPQSQSVCPSSESGQSAAPYQCVDMPPVAHYSFADGSAHLDPIDPINLSPFWGDSRTALSQSEKEANNDE